MSVHIYQKQFAFTEKVNTITMGSYGPCYCLTFKGGNFKAMAHVDGMTNIASIQRIFDKFLEQSVQPESIEVNVAGGWTDFKHSFRNGIAILTQLRKSGMTVKNLNMSEMFCKRTFNPHREDVEEARNNPEIYYSWGMCLDKDGKRSVITIKNQKLEEEQMKQLLALSDESKQYELTEVSVA